MEGLSLESTRKAFAAALERRVTLLSRRAGIYAFMGDEEDYLIIPHTYCSCPDFRIRVLLRGEKKHCYHLLAACLSITNGLVHELASEDDNVIYAVLREIFTQGRSATLRRARR